MMKEEESEVPETPAESPEVLPHSQEDELKDCKDKYLRLLAESENTRKRMQKEKQEAIRFAVEDVVTEFLAPIDNLEHALKFAKNMSEDVRQWALGFQMILTQFKDALSNHGIVPFDSEGKTFDPHKHQAVELEETTAHPEGTVLQEFVRGYRSGDRTIRPARVKIAKTPKPNSEEKV